MNENKLTYREAMASPCTSCSPALCCSLVHLDSIIADTLMDLDKINFYLNFNNIEICLTAEGEWAVYYNYPCRHYDTGTPGCRLHDTQQKPTICTQYNPYNCYYKKLGKTKTGFNPQTIWFNRERMDFLLDHVTFDEDRNISEISGREELYSAVARIPYTAPHRAEPGNRDITASLPPPENGPTVKTHLDLRESCGDCGAYCCRNLLFSQGIPETYRSLDFLRYALGFTGLELGISDARWYLIVHTHCRHLKEMKCSIYDTGERPLYCRYYDEMRCSYRACLERTGPDRFIRVGREEFVGLMDTFKFDQNGNLIEGRDVKSLRGHMESRRWDSAAAA